MKNKSGFDYTHFEKLCSENAGLFEVLEKEAESILEIAEARMRQNQKPFFHNIIVQGTLGRLIENMVDTEVLPTEMQFHEMSYYRTIFISFSKIYELGFFQDDFKHHEKISTLLQRYYTITHPEYKKIIADTQTQYQEALSKRSFFDESEYIQHYCEESIFEILGFLRKSKLSEKESLNMKKFFDALLEKNIIEDDEHTHVRNNVSHPETYFDLLFILLEKNIWKEESELKQEVGEMLYEYYRIRDDEKFAALQEYETSIEISLQKWMPEILKILENASDFGDKNNIFIKYFFTYLGRENVLTEDELQYYISEENIEKSLYEVLLQKLLLWKYLDENEEILTQTSTLLMKYYGEKNLDSSKVHAIQKYCLMNDITFTKTSGEKNTLEQSFASEDYVKYSHDFNHFLSVAMDLPNRIEDKQRDFFEGEGEVIAIFDRFLEIDYISEDEYYSFLEQAFEVSVYKILKKLYYGGFFSGDIEKVRMIKNTLLALAELIHPQEKDRLQEYFQIREHDLRTKENRISLENYALHAIDTIRSDSSNSRNELHEIGEDMLAVLIEDKKMIYIEMQENFPDKSLIIYNILYKSFLDGYFNTNTSLLGQIYNILIEMNLQRKDAREEGKNEIIRLRNYKQEQIKDSISHK